MRFPRFPLPMRVACGATNARSRMFDLADATVPGAAALLDLVFGLQRTKIAGALVSSGLADALAKDSRTPVELARELGLDPDVTTLAAIRLRLSANCGDRVAGDRGNFRQVISHSGRRRTVLPVRTSAANTASRAMPR